MKMPIRSPRAWWRDERGSVTVMVALTVMALMGVLALGVDLGALFNARSEAQRAADAAALAGASAFLDYQEGEAAREAQLRAIVKPQAESEIAPLMAGLQVGRALYATPALP